MTKLKTNANHIARTSSARTSTARLRKFASSVRIVIAGAAGSASLVKPLELGLWAVLVDQSLEARVFAQRVPRWIELEHRDGETVWDNEQMVEQSKCFVEFAGPGIDLRERSGSLRPIKGVLGFR